jgi:hypothetical protein
MVEVEVVHEGLNLFNSILLVSIAALNTFSAIVVARMNIAVANTKLKVDSTARDVRTIEIATNNMKDALVAATAKASDSEGFERGRLEGEVAAANLAKGRLSGKQEDEK